MGDITVSNKQEAHVVAQAPTVDLDQLAKLSPDAQRRNDGSWHSVVASGGKIDVRFQRHAANGQAVYEAKGEKSTVKIVAKSFEAAEETAKKLVANGSLAPRDDGQPKWPIPNLPVVEKTRPAAPPAAPVDKPVQGKTSWSKTQRVPPSAKRAWVPEPGFRGAENVRATEAKTSWNKTQRVPPSAKRARFPDPGFRGTENVRATEATASWSETQQVPPSAKTARFPDPGFRGTDRAQADVPPRVNKQAPATTATPATPEAKKENPGINRQAVALYSISGAVASFNINRASGMTKEQALAQVPAGFARDVINIGLAQVPVNVKNPYLEVMVKGGIGGVLTYTSNEVAGRIINGAKPTKALNGGMVLTAFTVNGALVGLKDLQKKGYAGVSEFLCVRRIAELAVG